MPRSKRLAAMQRTAMATLGHDEDDQQADPATAGAVNFFSLQPLRTLGAQARGAPLSPAGELRRAVNRQRTRCEQQKQGPTAVSAATATGRVSSPFSLRPLRRLGSPVPPTAAAAGDPDAQAASDVELGLDTYAAAGAASDAQGITEAAGAEAAAEEEADAPGWGMDLNVDGFMQFDEGNDTGGQQDGADGAALGLSVGGTTLQLLAPGPSTAAAAAPVRRRVPDSAWMALLIAALVAEGMTLIMRVVVTALTRLLA